MNGRRRYVGLKSVFGPLVHQVERPTRGSGGLF